MLMFTLTHRGVLTISQAVGDTLMAEVEACSKAEVQAVQALEV
jgi:hypothetical protein